jgi:hypothetical protein
MKKNRNKINVDKNKKNFLLNFLIKSKYKTDCIVIKKKEDRSPDIITSKNSNVIFNKNK